MTENESTSAPSIFWKDLTPCPRSGGICNTVGKCLTAESVYHQASYGGGPRSTSEGSPLSQSEGDVIGDLPPERPLWDEASWRRFCNKCVKEGYDQYAPCIAPGIIQRAIEETTAAKRENGDFI